MNASPSPAPRRFVPFVALGGLLAWSALACLPLVGSGPKPTSDAGENLDAGTAAPDGGRDGGGGGSRALVHVDGVVAIGVSGVRVAGGADPVSPEDPWHLGSDTKAMTAALAGRLVDRGVVTWDLEVTDVWPDADAGWQGVTLDLLLRHRGGASGNLGAQHPDLWAAAWAATDAAEGRRALVEGLLATPPDATVGEFTYSNAGYVIAGAMLEERSGRTWEDLMREEVFGPLGMTRCGFGAPEGEVPYGHRASGDTLIPVAPGPEADNPPALGPAGTVHCPLSDWGRFVAAHLPGHTLAGGEPYLSAATLDRLHTPTGEYAGGWLVTYRSWASPTGGDGKTLTHAGSNTLWFAVVWVAPELGRAFLATTNSATPEAQQGIDALIGALIAHSAAP